LTSLANRRDNRPIGSFVDAAGVGTPGHLGVASDRCAAIEDSENGIRSAKAAGMRMIAIPNRHFPPRDEALTEADVVLASLVELTARAVSGP
jgi:beta-phosphoglucomutase-like phosphatase (HAD superfamily)